MQNSSYRIQNLSVTFPDTRICTVRRVDYASPHDADALVQLLDAYAQDEMGGGEPLSTAVKRTLCQRLAAFPGACSWLAWAEAPEQAAGQPVGLLNAFLGFSTFKAQPLLNVHDVTVLPSWRGRGLAQQLLAAAEAHARAQGCCKMTLEVLSANQPALRLYHRHGFEGYTLSPQTGHALFMHKMLSASQ